MGGLVLTILAKKSNTGSSYTIILSAPSAGMKEDCSAESMKTPMGVRQCKSNCAEANCCYVAISLESSCLEDNNEVCDQYNSYCGTFYIAVQDNPGVIGVT